MRGRRPKNERRNRGEEGRGASHREGGGRRNKWRRREEREAVKRALRGGGRRRGVSQSGEVRENRSYR